MLPHSQVIPKAEQLSSLPPDLSSAQREAEWRARGIHFFSTYVGAAVAAHESGLVTSEGLARVGKAAVEDLIRMRLDYHASSTHDWQARIHELNADVKRANAVLPEELHVWSVPESTGAQQDLQKVLDGDLSSSLRSFAFQTPAPRGASS